MKIEWIQDTAKFSNGIFAVINKINLGSVYYDGLQPKDSKTMYGVNCYLPGIKDHLGNYETQEQAKEILANAINYWFKKIKG